MASFNIREATKDDCEDMFRMIQELAAYHKTSHLVKITVEDLKKDGFGEKPVFQALVAELSKEESYEGKRPLVGQLIYYGSYSVLSGRLHTMLEFYVSEEWRSRGIGSALMVEFVQKALSVGCKNVVWAVKTWNKRTIDFYRRVGACNDKECEDHLWMIMGKTAMEELVAQKNK